MRSTHQRLPSVTLLWARGKRKISACSCLELVVTRHVWGGNLSAEQMQETLAATLDAGRRHQVTVRRAKSGRLELEFNPKLGGREARLYRRIQERSYQSTKLSAAFRPDRAKGAYEGRCSRLLRLL